MFSPEVSVRTGGRGATIEHVCGLQVKPGRGEQNSGTQSRLAQYGARIGVGPATTTAAWLWHGELMHLSTVQDVQLMDPGAAIPTLDLDVHPLSSLGEFGERVVLTDVQPLAGDFDAGLFGVDLLDQTRDCFESGRCHGRSSGAACWTSVPSLRSAIH